MGGWGVGLLQNIWTNWKNTQSLPFVVRVLIRGAMVTAPILLLCLVFPMDGWKIDGRPVDYATLWSSGQGEAIAISLLLCCAGSWGFAARNADSRWLLVSMPVAPYIVLAMFPASSSVPITTDVIASAAVTAAVLYFCLFRLRAIREYLAV